MKTCIFCPNTRTFNIHDDFENSHTAKEDILQVFGFEIAKYLRSDDVICNLCMNIMDNVAKLKQRLLPLIWRTEDCKPLNLGKKWDVFASMNFDEDSRSSTPNNLLICKSVVPYESALEMRFAEKERYRSLSRSSLARSDADSEVSKAFGEKKTRRKRRGHNWSRRKSGRYSSLSTNTQRRTRSYSRKSNASISGLSITNSNNSSDEEMVRVPFVPKRNTLRYLDGCLQNKRTRSVSRQQEEEIRFLLRQDEGPQCTEEGCYFRAEDVSELTQHKISKHRQMALFACSFCKETFTSSEDLEIHKRSHKMQYICVVCHKEFEHESGLLHHWQDHIKSSVACYYCGKRFISKNVVRKHQRNVHKKFRIRIDYSNEQRC